ncbi:sensor domain-containing diguanylate cyclase, partial [Actinotalea sp. C106]|uniref:sensor domain-containing diguanylate cyclase n=1 Tax=Actinotalea sp. C106 TaxID=2908644 RepID=UPI0020278B72
MGAVSPLSPLVAALAALGVALVALALLLARSRRELAMTRQTAASAATAVSRRLAGVMASGRDGVVLHGAGGTVLEANEAAAALLGATTQALVGRAVTELPVRWRSETGQEVAPAAVFARRSEAWGEGVVLAVEPVGGGPQRWVQVWTRAVPTLDGGQELTTWLADISGRREALAAQARSEQQFQAAMEYAPIGMVLIDTQWRLTRVNAAFASLLGARPEALVGRDLSALSHPDDRAAERAGVHGLLAGQQSRLSLEKRYLRADGQTVWVVLDVVLVRLTEGEPDHFVAQVRDTTESRMKAEMLAHRAMHDPLTGLANRSLMQEVLQAAIDRPGADGRVAVLVIDLDEFKQINDRYGHPAGDDVLVHVAGVLRAATGGRGTAARLGGDEFVVVVEDPDAARAVFDVAAGIHRGLRNPVRAQR